MRAFLSTMLLLLVAGGPADAGLCRRPDGTYTNHCNEADAEVSGGTVSRSSAPASKPAATSARQRPAPAASDPEPAPDTGASERYWRDRHARAKEAVENAEKRLASAKASRESCMARQHDYDACNEEREEQAEEFLEKMQERLDGLFDECRQSSRCELPWVQ
jgi:hypothetical protein